ncbi:MAG TPA: Rieske (2Fe-2S) protein [Pseudonocardia sp.]|jgi:Rieske Fe-S protein|nr:Rieske (2Fe-2S) protein [Pseudonocardia sp.]
MIKINRAGPTPDEGSLNRRRALAAGGALTASAAALLVAGCSTAAPAAGAPVAAGQPGIGGPAAAPGPELARTVAAATGDAGTVSAATGGTGLGPAGAVPVGGGIIYPNESVVVTQPNAGTFKAFSATCTHQGCTVASVSGGTINCPCHGSRFAIGDGSVAHGPATRPLPARRVSNDGGTLRLP